MKVKHSPKRCFSLSFTSSYLNCASATSILLTTSIAGLSSRSSRYSSSSWRECHFLLLHKTFNIVNCMLYTPQIYSLILFNTNISHHYKTCSKTLIQSNSLQSILRSLLFYNKRGFVHNFVSFSLTILSFHGTGMNIIPLEAILNLSLPPKWVVWTSKMETTVVSFNAGSLTFVLEQRLKNMILS